VNALIRQYAERIDAANLRQRLLIFLAAAALLLFLANALLLQPQRVKQKRLALETAQSQKNLAALQAQVSRLIGAEAGGPDAALRKRQAALRAELSQLNSRIAGEEGRFTAPERMRALLEEMLGRNKGLTLVDLRTLPVVAVTPHGAPGAPAASAGMFRHGIELTVRGSYGELYDYLRMLEGLPSQLYWSRAELTVTDHPLITLKLTVHTISFDRAWLVV
jgi:MSHA biogenesis protein MshJ